MSAMRIGVAGAGLLGRLLAWRLSRMGCDVTVFDPADGVLDRSIAAGWTAAGMLSPIAELEGAQPSVAELGWRSLSLWSKFVAELPEPVHFRRDGSLLLAHRNDAGSAKRLTDVLARKLPPHIRLRSLTSQELSALEPAVSGPTLAWFLEGEGQIHTVQAMLAFAKGAIQYKVKWRWKHSVKSLAGGQIDGERFDHVFDVRGLGARLALKEFEPSPTDTLRGVRGELLWVRAPGVSLHRPIRLILPRMRVYLVPRPDDIIVIGASEIESEDRSPISVRTLTGLLTSAYSVIPEIAEARLVHTETNLRPAFVDNMPHVEHKPALTRINGLFRHGWLIAPALVEDALNEIGIV